MSPAFGVFCCLILLEAWKPTLASTEPFFAHMASCVGEPITAVIVPPSDQAALAAWNNVFTKGSDIKGGSAGTFVQVYHKAKSIAMSALVLRRRWNRCRKMACVPNTLQQTISCQSLYFSYNPHRRACMPQKGFCHQSMNHFLTLDNCKLACAGPAETGRAALPQPQDTEIRLNIIRKKNGISATLVNSTLNVPPKKSLFFVGYLLPDPYGPLKGTVKKSPQSQAPEVKTTNNRPQDNNSHLSQMVPKQLPQVPKGALSKTFIPPLGPPEVAPQVERGIQMPPQKVTRGGSLMNASPPGFLGNAGVPTKSPKPLSPEQLTVAKALPPQAPTKATDNKSVIPALPIGPAASLAQNKGPGMLPAQPLNNANNILGGPPTFLPSGAVGAKVPPIEGHLAMPASIPGVSSAEESSSNQLSDVPLPLPTSKATGALSSELLAGGNIPLSIPSSRSASEDSAISSQQESSSSEQDSNSSTEETQEHKSLMQPSSPEETKVRQERSAPPNADKLAGRIKREQPRRALPLARYAISRREARQRSARMKPVVEEKISADRAPLTGVGTSFGMPRSFSEPLMASNRRQRRSGYRAARWAHRRGPGLASSISN